MNDSTPNEANSSTTNSQSGQTPDATSGRPRIGDTRPAPAAESEGSGRTRGRGRGGRGNKASAAEQDTGQSDANSGPRDDANPSGDGAGEDGAPKRKRRRRGGRGRGRSKGGEGGDNQGQGGQGGQGQQQNQSKNQNSGGGRQRSKGRGGSVTPVEASAPDGPVELDEDVLERRRGKSRKGRPVGRYQMCVSVGDGATQIAVLEGQTLIEHYVSRPADDVTQIHGNIYVGRVQNVLPGMEAAFLDIATPKNAVIYKGDTTPPKGKDKYSFRIEHALKPKQLIICQVTKNPIAHKGARLTQEVSLPGRFVVLVPNSTTYGISKRLPDSERKRLRKILDRVRPDGCGLIVRTAAEHVTAEELERDVAGLLDQWRQIEQLASKAQGPALLYREPEAAVRIIREEFNKNYRGIVIDDPELFEEVRDYVNAVSPALADRVEYYDPSQERLSLFEKNRVHEQLRKAVDDKVWLPSGGSLIIEHTEALTVIDVNTGKNVGRSSLEDTVFANNKEAAIEIAHQLRLRDIGGIIVIDFVDMEIRKNRDEVIRIFREELGRDKTRTQAFDITDLGLVEMTRKRIGEGLLESVSERCEDCEGRGLVMDKELLDQ